MKNPYHFGIEFHDYNRNHVTPEKKRRKEFIALLLSLLLLFTTSIWAMEGIVSYAAERELRLGETYDVELHDVHGTTEQIITSSELTAGVLPPSPMSINGVLGQVFEKRLFMKNATTSDGAIFVRMQLTERFQDFDGTAPLKTAIFSSTLPMGVLDPTTIEWQIGSPIQSLASWDESSYGDFWLMDESTGYAYWMNPLEPGEQTWNFLNHFVPRKETPGGYQYSIRVLADGISATETTDREFWGHDSAYDDKLDTLFTLYQSLVSP